MPGELANAPEPDQRPILEVEVVHHAGDWSPVRDPAGLAQAGARAIVQKLGSDVAGGATIVLADDAEVRRLNATWRGKDKPTNVLSFPAPETPGPRPFLGDVILAVETICTEAGDMQVPPEHHFQHLVVHGLLHLLGYDHEADEEAEEMEALESEILGELGVPDPYADQLPATA